MFNNEERATLLRLVQEFRAEFADRWEKELSAKRLQLSHVQERMDRLTDAYVDGVIEKAIFERRKASILEQESALAEATRQPKEIVVQRLSKFLELAGDAYSLYKMSIPDEKRELLKGVTSNRLVSAKKVAITLKPPFQQVANRHFFSNGAPYRDRLRTLDALVRRLADWFENNPGESFDVESIRQIKHSSPIVNLKLGDAA